MCVCVCVCACLCLSFAQSTIILQAVTSLSLYMFVVKYYLYDGRQSYKSVAPGTHVWSLCLKVVTWQLSWFCKGVINMPGPLWAWMQMAITSLKFWSCFGWCHKNNCWWHHGWGPWCLHVCAWCVVAWSWAWLVVSKKKLPQERDLLITF